MQPDYIDYMVKHVHLKPLNEELSSNVKQTIECLLCGDHFDAAPKGKVANFKKHGRAGCKKCTTKERYGSTRKDGLQRLSKKFEIISNIDEQNIDNKKMIKVKNKLCGHTFESKYGNLLNRDINCPVCNNERKRKLMVRLSEKMHTSALKDKEGFKAYRLKVDKLTRENYKKYKDIINPNNYKRGLSGSSEDVYHLDHIVSVRNCFDLSIPPDICAHVDNLRMVKWKSNNNKWKRSAELIPQIFLKYVDDITTHFIDYFSNYCSESVIPYREVLGTTVTMDIPKKNASILLVNTAMTTERMVGTKKYLWKIKEKFNNAGKTLLIIYDDEWRMNNKMVADKILHYIKGNNKQRIHARKCLIKEVSNEEKNKFLNNNHIQGTSVSQINYGAYYFDTLVAVMTFCSPRVLMNKKSFGEGVFELSRFATDNSTRVPGIASKLFKHFLNKHSPTEVYSFADARWSEGNMYDKLGFNKVHTTPPGYYYVIEGKRYHRWGFRKDALKTKFPDNYNPELTEYDNMLNMGHDRIWDCGKIKYVYKL